MQVQSFQSTPVSRKHTFDIPFNASQLKLRRFSLASALDALSDNVTEMLSLEHNNSAARVRSELFVRVGLGAVAVVSALGEKNPSTGATIVPAVPIFETYDAATGLFATDFIIQMTPGNALHTDGDNTLKLLLDDAFISNGSTGASYDLSLHENPVSMPWYNKVQREPSLQGPVEHTIFADRFRFVTFPADATRINRVSIRFSNGEEYDFSVADILRDMYEAMPIQGIRRHIGLNPELTSTTRQFSTSPRIYVAQDSQICVVNCANITEIKLHTDGSIIEVTTFAVASLGA